MRNKELGPGIFQTPFTLMRRFSDDMERIFEDVGFRRPFGFFTPELKSFDWTPAIELFEKDRTLYIRAELPGLTKEDVKIDMNDDVLTIQGERKYEKEEKKEGYLRTERTYGSFYRQIALPEGVKVDLAKAIFKNGILEIQVPLEVKKAIGRKLEIQEGEKIEKKELVGV